MVAKQCVSINEVELTLGGVGEAPLQSVGDLGCVKTQQLI